MVYRKFRGKNWKQTKLNNDPVYRNVSYYIGNINKILSPLLRGNNK